MLKKDETKLEIIGFGEEDDSDKTDTFYCLVNLRKSPDGIDLKKLSLADPRNFDQALERMGCILLLRGDEVEELIKRGDIADADIHTSLYELAKREDIIA